MAASNSHDNLAGPSNLPAREAVPRSIGNAAFDGFPDAFAELDPEGRIVNWNSQAEASFGWPRAEAAGQKLCDLVVSPLHQEDFRKSFEAFRDSQSAAAPSRVELTAVGREGREVPVELSFFPTRRGEAEHLGVFLRDISYRKQLERGAEERLQTLIDQLGEEFYETDLRGNFTFANSSFTGYYLRPGTDDLKGRNFREYIDEADAKMLRDGFHKVYVTGERLRQEFPIVFNGRFIYVEHTISLKRDGNGKPVGFMVLSRDCTERKLAQIELAKAKEVAEAANKAKSEFLANMSHEIRTPLNGVVGMLELARDTNLTAEQKELLEIADASANGLLSVINDILDFSKIEAGKLEFDRIEFEIREVVAEALRATAIRAHQKSLELAYDVAPDVPTYLLGDPGRLKQVLINLVGNAIKFTERGEVVLRIKTLDAAAGSERVELRFSVTDTGIGIGKEKQRLIFEAFSQADASTTRRYGGTGLGLAISSRLVKLMGGEISVESELGLGSTFRFRCGFALGTGAGLAGAPVTKQALRGLAVLVVDDNATNRRILETVLSSWGMLPTGAESGERALELLNRAAANGAPFPLVLTDYQMPGMDGFELVRQIRSASAVSAASIMMLTSDDYQSSAPRCRELGVEKHLIKPIKQSELLAALLGLLQPSSLALANAVSGKVRRDEPEMAPLKILLAEDNAVNQMLAARMLEKLGHSVVIAANGLEALAHLEKQTFDLALMDVQMPEMDGLAATRSIRDIERDRKHDGETRLPIIALTAHAMSGDRQLCLEAGMDDYIPKPIDFQQLKQTIARVAHSQARPGLAIHSIEQPCPAKQ